MYWWVDDEAWVSDGAPAVTEMHGRLADPQNGEEYGRILNDDEERRVRAALLQLLMELRWDDPYDG